MSTTRGGIVVALFAVATVLAACNGPAYAPALAGSPLSPVAASALRSIGVRPPDASLPFCSAPAATLPGTYVTVAALGEIRHGRFAGRPLRSLWVQASFVAASPPPSTGPSATPSILPSLPPVRAYLYYGSFTLAKTHQTGCAYVVASKSGRPIPGTGANAALAAVPNLASWFSISGISARGYALTKISHLNASGGSGTLVLENSTGTTFDTGTVTLTGRLTVP